MLRAIRYTGEYRQGYWQVLTQEGVQEYTNLRQFMDLPDIFELAQQSTDQPGKWIERTSQKAVDEGVC